MNFLMLTILEALTKNLLVSKTQTTHHAYICFLRIVQDTSKIYPQLKLESDFYKLVVTVLNMFNEKRKPKIIQYRNYKTFSKQLFRIELDKGKNLI